MSETAPQPSPEQPFHASHEDTEEDQIVITDTLRDLVESKNVQQTTSAETAQDEEAEKSELPKSSEARESLLRRHALQQTMVETTATGVQKIESIIHTTQNAKSAIKTFVLDVRESRAQRRYERHAHKAEDSLFAFRRRKFARKAKESKARLDSRTASVNTHDTFIETRQANRDIKTSERNERVNSNREFLLKRSKIAIERRQRRHDLLEGIFTLRDDRKEEILRKRKTQLPMIQFRQAVFTNIKSA